LAQDPGEAKDGQGRQGLEDQDDRLVGQRVGNYRIVRRLGEGGMGTVYLAEHPGLGRRLAVKILHPDLARNDEMIQRFFNEARAANAIGHRGVVEVSDFGVLPAGEPYLAMEYLDGESLTEKMMREGRLPLAAAIDIACQIAGVVGAAHARGIVHRDLKPDNLFLVADPLAPGRKVLKVLDFGIAKLAAQQPTTSAGGDVRTRTGTILGTPRYMSPEQCRETRDVDHRTDIYSLGVILYEMLSGTPPFVSSSWGELAHMHIGVSPPALQSRVPDVPTRIEEIVLRTLAKEPEARFQSMAELRETLEATIAARTLVLPEAVRDDAAAATQVSAAPPFTLFERRAAAPGHEPGATMRLVHPTTEVARATRRTTLASAASELGPPDGESVRPRTSFVPALAAAVAVAAIAGLLALLGRHPEAAPPPPVATPAPSAPAPPAPTPSATALAAPVPSEATPTAPAPTLHATQAPTPAATTPERPAAEATAPRPAAAGGEKAPRPARAKPPRRRHPSGQRQPATPPAPAAKPQEPLKI
jgi:serine/threonine-protein kinase